MKIIKVREINMRGIKDKKTGGMNLKKPKISLVLIFTIILSIFIGLFSSNGAQAAIAPVTAWTEINNTNPNTLTPNVTSTSTFNAGGTLGDNRILLVAVSFSTTATGVTMRSSAANNIVVTYGTQAVTKLIGGDDGVTAGRNIVWLGYVKDANIPSGAQSVNVTGTVVGTNVTDVKIFCASFNGVDQSTSFTDSKWSQTTAAAATGTALSFNYNANDWPIFFVDSNPVGLTISSYTPAKYTTAVSSTTLGSAHIANRTTNPASNITAESTNVTFSGNGRVGMIAASLKVLSCLAVQPTLSLGTVTPTSVGLTWTTNAGNNYYNVYRNGVKISTDGAVITGAYTDSTATPDTVYNTTGYTVRGYNTAGLCESSPSTAVTVTTPSVTPVAPTVNNPQVTTLDVAIGTESPANPSTTTYAIRINGGGYVNQYINASGGVQGTAVWQNKSTWATKTVTGLSNGTTYTFDVQARNQALTTTTWSPTANGTTVTPCAATAPTALAASAGTTSTSIPLTWTAGTNTDYYNVYRNAVKISTNGVVTGTTFTDSTASPSVTYAYTVKGYNTAGTCESPVSNTLNKSTLAAVPGAPVVVNMSATTALVDIGTDTNSTEATYAIRINSSVYTNQYVQAGGTIGASAVWQTKAVWGSKLVTGLTSVLCTFDVKARNGNGELLETAFGATASVTPHVALPSTITSCADCHGYGATMTDGSARNVPDGKFPGSHTKHVSTYGKACSVCHVTPAGVTSAYFNHRNGTIEMASPINGNIGAAYVKGASFAQTSQTAPFTGCTNTSCHDNGTAVATGAGPSNTSINWGTTATCGSCHGGDSTGRPAYANNTPKKNSHMASTHAGTTCDKCHYATTTDGTSIASVSTHNNGAYNLDANTGASVTFTYVYNAGGGTCSSVSCHGTAQWGVTQFDCITCHSSAMGSRRIIAGASGEFGLAWGHKNSTQATVTKFDCTVCHMEGTVGTGAPNATYHKNGTIELRDPDTGLTIKGVTFGGAGAGTYTSTGTDLSFTSFSRNLSVGLESDPNFLVLGAIMTNHCLKCHDSDGALNANAQVPTTGTALKPFGTTVASTNAVNQFTYIAALDTQGAVVDVKSQFLTTNASYHPISGRQNNSFADIDRLKTPWNTVTKTAGTNTGWGPLISCWDCHAPAGTASTVTLTSSVTAHGAATTIRADGYGAASAATPNLCTTCHIDTYGVTNGTQNHGANSAFATGGSGTRYDITNCYLCHSSNNNSRPFRGVDAHGFDRWASIRTNDTTTPVNSLTSGPTTATGHRPYAFLRTDNMHEFSPLSVPEAWTPAGPSTPGCNTPSAGTCNRTTHGTIGPGGTY